MLLRGGAEQFIDETERSLHDAIMIVRRAMKNDAIVAGMTRIERVSGTCMLFVGGGAIDMELSRHIREISRTIAGKEQLLLAAFARSFEVT